MNQKQSEQSLLLRKWGEYLTVEYMGKSTPIPDEIYFGYSKLFFGCMEYIYDHKWLCKWMPNSTERAYFCIRVMSVWVTCVKHTGIVNINYLYTKAGLLLLKQLMLDLLPDMTIEAKDEFDSYWEGMARNIQLHGPAVEIQ